jgi:hypothetical protein
LAPQKIKKKKKNVSNQRFETSYSEKTQIPKTYNTCLILNSKPLKEFPFKKRKWPWMPISFT